MSIVCTPGYDVMTNEMGFSYKLIFKSYSLKRFYIASYLYVANTFDDRAKRERYFKNYLINTFSGWIS